MAGPGRPGRRSKAEIEAAETDAAVTETVAEDVTSTVNQSDEVVETVGEVAVETQEQPKKPNIGATNVYSVADCYRYHVTEEPRLFRRGDFIPEGWESTVDTVGWYMSDDARWHRPEPKGEDA